MLYDKEKCINIALAGNPNCGKTTLFNLLTGSNQRIGNFPGVTVEKKSGIIKNNPNMCLTDLPGMYSLSCYSSEEAVSKNFILNQNTDVIINIIDASGIERSLYLTLELIRLNIPVVLALNMMDEVKKNGQIIDIAEMEKILGIYIVPISASKNEGIDALLKSVSLAAKNKPKKSYHSFSNSDKESADMKFSFIKSICDKTVIKPKENKGHARSVKIDKILTGKYTAFPVFIIIMSLIFYLTFNVIGAFFQKILESGIESFTDILESLLTYLNVNKTLHLLITDGIVGGIGSVLSFTPTIAALFFFLSILEDSGYMARIAFIMDKPLAKLGLTGKSIVPFLMGFGCSVPSVMATRVLHSRKEKKMAIILIPFASCSAKLPVYGFLTAMFFPKYSGFIITLLYAFGILIGILTAYLLKDFVLRGEETTFIMELPNYRMPNAKNTFYLLCDKVKDFMQRAFTVIFAFSVIIYLLKTFDFKLNIVSDAKESILAHIANVFSPVFAPLGFDNWIIVTSIISGFMAKESVVSTLFVLTAKTRLTDILSPISCAALLVFCLLYTPCVATIASIKRELGTKWALLVASGQFLVAYLCALIIRAILILTYV